jgi:hypothetical protein
MSVCSIALAVVVVVSLVFAGVAAADREKVRLTAAGQEAARAAVLQRADLGVGSGWTGGPKKPDLSSTPSCPTFRPKQSDLVLIGVAENIWSNVGLRFDSEVEVLQTPEMVRLDWKRAVLDPQALPCLRSGLTKKLGASARLVSLRRIGVPRLATYTRAYRALLDVKTTTATVRVMVDVLLVGRGRTETTLTTTAPAASAAQVGAAELRLARLMTPRIRS